MRNEGEGMGGGTERENSIPWSILQPSLPDYCRYTLPWMKGLFHPTRTTVLSIVSLLLNFFQSRIDYIESGI